MNVKTEILEILHELLSRHLKIQSEGPFLQYKDPEQLKDVLRLDSEAGEGNWGEIFSYIEKYLQYSVHTNNPRFLNRMWSGANLPSILGEMVCAVSNTSSCTYEAAPVAILMEKYMIQQMLDVVGFTNGEGLMTTGSSNANMLAMMAARNEHLQMVKSKGLFSQKKLIGFVSEDAHYSMEKAANILGIGTENLIKVPVNNAGEMDIPALEQQLQKAEGENREIFYVGATAGTTVRGAYDSIEELLALRKSYGFWLHIDGAWGGAAVVSDQLKRKYMKGVEMADSLTWDFHKMLGTSLMCNIFLVNNRIHTLGKVCSAGDDSYIFHGTEHNDVLDLGSVSLQCGRRVDSLKWFLDWKFFGKEGFAKRVERNLELCQYAEAVIQENSRLELVFPRNSFNICFRYKTEYMDSGEISLQIRKKLYHSGHSLVGYAYHENRPILRLLLANHELTKKDIDEYFTEIIATGKALEVAAYETSDYSTSHVS